MTPLELLKQHPSILSYMFEKCQTIYIQLSKDGVILDCNEGWTQLLHLEKNPVDRPLADFIEDGEKQLSLLSTENEFTLTIQLPSERISIYCSIMQKDDSYYIIGIPKTQTEVTLLQQLTDINNEMTNLTRDLHKKNQQLEHARDKIKTLSGMLPICASCKNIRDDKGYWSQIESYIAEHSEATFSHGICPDCMEKLYPDYMQRKKNK